MANIADMQKFCDKSKYLESIKEERDMAGAMDYCIECKHSTDDYRCDLEHEERVAKSVCGRAYNRYRRKK